MEKVEVEKFCESAKKQIEALTVEAAELLQELTGLKRKKQTAAAARDRCFSCGDMAGFTSSMEDIASCRAAGTEKLARLNAIPGEAREIQRGISPRVKAISPLEQVIAAETKGCQHRMVELRDLRGQCHSIGNEVNRAVIYIGQELQKLNKDDI